MWIAAFAMTAWRIYFSLGSLAPKMLQIWNQHMVQTEDIGAMQEKASDSEAITIKGFVHNLFSVFDL